MLIVFLITLATCPLSTEFNSLTIIIKQEHRTSRDKAKRMSPMARSGRSEFAKRCWPEKEKENELAYSFLPVILSPALVLIHSSKKIGPKHTQLEGLMERGKIPPSFLHQSHVWVRQETCFHRHASKIHSQYPYGAGRNHVHRRGVQRQEKILGCSKPHGAPPFPRGGCMPEKGCWKSCRACIGMEIS